MTPHFSSGDLKVTKHSKLSSAIEMLLDEYPLKGKSESLKIGVLYKKQAFEFHFGVNTYKYYDLASLTKVIFSVCAIYNYEASVGSIIDTIVVDIIPWFKASGQITVKDVLAHQSGAPALFPVFKTLKYPTTMGLDPLNLLLRDVAFDQDKVVYSDVGFFILGAILEQLYKKPLFLIFEHLRTVFPMGDLHFNVLGEEPSPKKILPNSSKALKSSSKKIASNLKFPKTKYAPTEICSLRQKTIQGEVHDENCWRMGGVGPHAGLFGDVHDVMVWLSYFKDLLHKKNKVNAGFLQKQKGDWRLGSMVPSKPVSSCGQYFSDQSWGHLGFTGTSFWVDPKVDLSVVILSHRTYPGRDNKSFNILRPLIHDRIYTTLIPTKSKIEAKSFKKTMIKTDRKSSSKT
jgi:CubicO group peptidase (beta-lactamase class C family)